MEMLAKSQFKGTREWMKGDEDLLSFQQRLLAADNDAQAEADMISNNAVRRGSPEEAVYWGNIRQLTSELLAVRRVQKQQVERLRPKKASFPIYRRQMSPPR